MTQRYAHLPPAQKLDAVQRLTRRTTGTSPEPAEERVGSRRRKSVISGRKRERATGVEPATSSLGIWPSTGGEGESNGG